MSISLMTLLLWLVTGAARLREGLTGRGGGVIVVPALTLMFHTDVQLCHRRVDRVRIIALLVLGALLLGLVS